MTKFLNNADIKGYIAQTAVTSYLLKADSTGRLVAAIAGTDYQAPTTALLPSGGTAGQILAKIDGTNYSTQWIDNFAQQIKYDVKLGAALSKGTPVYVSSANGTNIIVSASSNATEATSSKTLGLLETGGALNDIVKVVSDGLLSGLNTSAATIGDPVWLGVNGALIFGLANKPSAPAHLVYIGAVTRVHANNGEIFIKVQNGFELDELHNVALSSLADGQGLFYESATSLWKNKTIASVLGYTPANGANYLPLSGGTISGDLTISSTNPRLYFTDTDNNPDYFISNTDGIFTVYDVTNSVGRFKIYTTGNAELSGSLTAGGFNFATGARTFKSYTYGTDLTVNTAGGWAQSHRIYNEASPTQTWFFGAIGTTAYIRFGNPAVIDITGYNGTGFGLSSAGAATFDSSVSATNITLGSGTIGSIPSWMKVITTDATQSGIGAIFNNKALYLYNNGSAIKLDAYDYGTSTGLNIQIGGNGGKIIASNGQVQFTAYTSATSYSGTAAGYLAFDSSGNVITVAGVAATDSTKLPLAGGTLTGFFYSSVSSKIVVQGSNDGGSSRGIFMWNATDPNWGIYMAQAGASKTIADTTAPSGIDSRTEHAIRFRVAASTTQIGFLWENSNDVALMQLQPNTGNLYTRGQIYAGNSTSNLVYHSGNLTNLNQLTNGPGYITSSGTAASANQVTLSNLNTQQVVVSLAAGSWYTIAANAGDRASAKFTITDATSGLHQAIHFYASAHFGTYTGAKITVLNNTYYSGPPISAIRTMIGSTYDGAMVQVYAASACTITVSIYDNQQVNGWVIKSGIVSTTNPGTVATYTSLTTVGAQVDVGSGKSFSVSDDIYIGGRATQYLALHAGNYNSYSPTLTGGGASGTWGINVTGSAGGLATNATGTEIYNNGWFRSNNSNTGLYNQATTQHWSSNTNGYWDVSSTTAASSGVVGIRLYAGGHVNTLRGYFYSDGSGIGILNNQGGWSVICYQGASYGGELRGTWTLAGNTIWTNANAPRAGNSNLMYYAGFTLDANTMPSNSTGFTYSVNAPYTGPIAKFSEDGYPLQLNATYSGGNNFAFRTRNGDAGSWNPWKEILHSSNYSSYALPLSGGTLTGTTLVNGGSSFVASGYNNSGGYAMNNAGQYWGLMWNYSTNDWRLGYGSQTAQVGWNLRWDASGNVYVNNNLTIGNAVTIGASGSQYALNVQQSIANGDFNNAIAVANLSSGQRVSIGMICVDTDGQHHRVDLRAYKGSGTYEGQFRIALRQSGSANYTERFYLYANGNLSIDGSLTTGGLIRVNTNDDLYLDYNYGCSIVGVYSSYRYQGVYSMGNAYKLARDGSSTGNLYGMAWSHPNAGGIASNLNTHGLILMENGSFLAAISGRIRTRDEIYSGGWMYSSGGNTGWLQDNQNQGIRAAGYNSYFGTIATYGNNSNGYGGYTIMNNYRVILMQNSSGDFGFYNNDDWKWNLFYNRGNDCWGIGTDNTYSGDGFRCIKYGSAQYGWTTWSDRRAKENISTITGALDKVLNMRGVYFNYIIDEEKTKRVGFIAQELQEILPEAVRYAEEIDEYNVEYGQIVSVLTEAIKEQNIKIQSLEAQLQTLLN